MAGLGRPDGLNHVRVLRRAIAAGDRADEQQLVDAGEGVDHRLELEIVALEHLDAAVGEALRLLQARRCRWREQSSAGSPRKRSPGCRSRRSRDTWSCLVSSLMGVSGGCGVEAPFPARMRKRPCR